MSEKPKKDEPFPDYYAKEADSVLTHLNCKTIPDVDDLIVALSVFNEEIANHIKTKKQEFTQWYPHKSKDHRLRLLRDWCGETGVGSSNNNNSSTTAHANHNDTAKQIDKESSTTTTTGTSTESNTHQHNHSPVTHYQEPTILMQKSRKVKKMPWFPFMCRLLQRATALVHPDCIPIMGDLIRHTTGNGKGVPPHFSFVIHPGEQKLYEELTIVLKQVIAQCKEERVCMADNLSGNFSIDPLPDGRQQFSLRIEKLMR